MPKSIFFLLLFCTRVHAMHAQTGQQESSLKAAFIYNFTKYIDWQNTIGEENFIIGVIGNSEVAAALRQIAAANTVGNKKIEIQQYSRPSNIRRCHILFISRDTRYTLREILDKTYQGTLTIGEESGYAQRGAALNFVLVNDKLKFEANLEALEDAGLKASSQLLKLAIIVD